jgi:nucleoside diphosphate kinase
MSERTLAIIKPDAVRKQAIGDIINRYEKAALKPVAMKLLHMAKPVAEGFYAVHKSRPFFDSLCTFMSSGPSVVLVLQGDNAIKKNRENMDQIRLTRHNSKSAFSSPAWRFTTGDERRNIRHDSSRSAVSQRA